MATAVPMAEAVVLCAVAPAARLLAPQATALAPLAVYHDLRWLFGSGGGWPGAACGPWLGFAVPLAALLAVRSALDGVLAWLAWPHRQARPRARALAGAAVAFALTAGLLMVPLVALTFGVALLPFSWPLIGVLPLLVLLSLLLSHGGITSSWWWALPTVRAAGWLALDFLALSAAAVVIARLRGGWPVPAAGASGIVNARAWYGVTQSVAVPRIARRIPRPAWRLPVAPVAAIAAIGLVIGVMELGFTAGSGSGERVVTVAALPAGAGEGASAAAMALAGTGGAPVLKIAGFASSCCTGHPAPQAYGAGSVVRQFSYRGIDSRGQPLPYGPTATNLPLAVLGDLIAAQVRQLEQATGRPADLVAESEGTLGVYAMLARHPRLPVGSIVLLSPIVAPGGTSYPTGSGGAPASVPGYLLRAVAWAIGGITPYGSSGAAQLISSVDGSGARYASQAARVIRHRHLRWMAVVPLADSITLPAASPLPPQAVIVPALHGALLGSPAVQRMIGAFLAGRRIPDIASMRQAAEIAAQAAAAWRMPETPGPAQPCP